MEKGQTQVVVTHYERENQDQSWKSGFKRKFGHGNPQAF